MSTQAGKMANAEKSGGRGVGFLLGSLLRGKSRGGGMTAEDWENQNTLEDLRHARDKEFESHRSEEGRKTISHKEEEGRKTITHKEREGRKTITHKRKERGVERDEVLGKLDERPHIGSYKQGDNGKIEVSQGKRTRGWKAPGAEGPTGTVANPGVGRQLRNVTPKNNTKTASSGVNDFPNPNAGKVNVGGPKYPRMK
jgi:hypothetical protein